MLLQAHGHTAAAPLPKTASCPLLRRWPRAAVGGPMVAPFAPGEGATAPLGPQPSKCLVNAGSSKPCMWVLQHKQSALDACLATGCACSSQGPGRPAPTHDSFW